MTAILQWATHSSGFNCVSTTSVYSKPDDFLAKNSRPMVLIQRLHDVLRLMRFERQIKPGLPGFALVNGGDADLPDAAFHDHPRTTRESLLTRDDLSSCQHHLSRLKISLDDEQLAAIGHPTLV